MKQFNPFHKLSLKKGTSWILSQPLKYLFPALLLFFAALCLPVNGSIADSTVNKCKEIYNSLTGNDPLFSQEGFHIALVGPMSGKGKDSGIAMQQGIELYLAKINSQGGIHGRPVILDVYDDQNKKNEARKQALAIAKNNQAVAIIGHVYSSCSMAGSAIYEENGIPAISPASTHIDVTTDNPYYFRTIFDDNLQGRFLAQYSAKIFASKSVFIIHEELPYGSYLADVFAQTSLREGVAISGKELISTKEKDLAARSREVAQILKETDSTGTVFLATHATEGATILKHLRDAGIKNTIMASDSFNSATFRNKAAQYEKENGGPGYYSNGIYVASPLGYDTAPDAVQQFRQDYIERYNSSTDPDWRAVTSYNATVAIVAALREKECGGTAETLREDREKVRDFLANADEIKKGIQSITGKIYFDKRGNQQLALTLSKYQSQQLISSLAQLQPVSSPGMISNLEDAFTAKRILKVDDKLMYKTNVAYTGVELLKVSDFSVIKRVCTLEFNLWFRFHKDTEIENIEFLNAVEPVKLEKPVKEVTREQISYRLYHVTGKFKTDFLPSRIGFGEHVIGISLRHRALLRNNLIFVVDTPGMALNSKESLAAELNANHVLSDAQGWTIVRAVFFQNNFATISMGDPEYLDSNSGKVLFSRFNLKLLVEKEQLTFRNTIPIKLNKYLLGGGLLLLFLLFYLDRRKKRLPVRLLKIASGLLIILCLETLLIDWLQEYDKTGYKLNLAKQFFDILWWLIPAWLFTQAVEILVWHPLERKTGNNVPSIVRSFLRVFIYLMAFFAIIAFVYEQKITSLLATSGVIAMIIGLALQVNLSNIFSGIALSLEQPFRIGDWIKVEGLEAAKVIEMNWRTIRLQTVLDTIYCVPNSKAADSTLLNYHYPDDYYWLFFPIYINSEHHPNRVMKVIMDALLETAVVQRHMGPIVRMDYTDKGIAYYPIFVLKDYGARAGHKNAVSKNIWVHLNRAGITPAVPRQEIQYKPSELDPVEKASQPLNIIDASAIFNYFPSEIKDELAAQTRQRFIPMGQHIFKQGDQAESMFIVSMGTISIRILSDRGEAQVPVAHLADGGGIQWVNIEQEDQRKTMEVARLGVGEPLGEMGLLGGEPRSADAVAMTDCYLLEITKEVIIPLVKKYPHIKELFADYIMKIKAADIEREEEMLAQDEAIARAEANKNIRQRIMNSLIEFFDQT